MSKSPIDLLARATPENIGGPSDEEMDDFRRGHTSTDLLHCDKCHGSWPCFTLRLYYFRKAALSRLLTPEDTDA